MSLENLAIVLRSSGLNPSAQRDFSVGLAEAKDEVTDGSFFDGVGVVVVFNKVGVWFPAGAELAVFLLISSDDESSLSILSFFFVFFLLLLFFLFLKECCEI